MRNLPRLRAFRQYQLQCNLVSFQFWRLSNCMRVFASKLQIRNSTGCLVASKSPEPNRKKQYIIKWEKQQKDTQWYHHPAGWRIKLVREEGRTRQTTVFSEQWM